MSPIETYIAQSTDKTRTHLTEIYAFIKNKLPFAEECMSYNMPCFKMNGHAVIYFAGNKHHIGLYPTSKPIEALKHRFEHLKCSKGAVQLPLDRPLPLNIIEELIDYRLRMLQK